MVMLFLFITYYEKSYNINIFLFPFNYSLWTEFY